MKAPARSSGYSYNAAQKQVAFSSPIPASQAHILGVWNTTRGVWLYQPRLGFLGTWASPILTVATSTSGHSDTDQLELFWDDGLNQANTALQAAGNASLSSIDGKIASGLGIPQHDFEGYTYTGSNVTQIVYKTGGAGGTTVATVNFAYDANNRITSQQRVI
jgi:hypothetical protein